jgi:hypothetical protein
VSVLAAALSSWPPEAWTALAAWVTAAIALVAGIVAWRQLSEARRLRREQAQPYVAVFMDHSGADPKFMDLVVRNFGKTAATDIVVRIDPAPQRAAASEGGYEKVWLPDRLPTLVPGQEWREMWDFTPDRAATDLPNHHEAVVTFKDPQGGKHCFSYILDWGTIRNRMSVKVYGIHDAAKALREIGKTLSKSDSP